MKRIVFASWYFNPIHPGHIECLELCKNLWDELRVIVNNDKQVKIKTWLEDVFQDEKFRVRVVWALKVVDYVFLSIDQDWSVCESLRALAKRAKEKYWEDVHLIFWKWWDRFTGNIPEVAICNEEKIEIKDGLGAKTHNSSDYRAKRN